MHRHEFSLGLHARFDPPRTNAIEIPTSDEREIIHHHLWWEDDSTLRSAISQNAQSFSNVFNSFRSRKDVPSMNNLYAMSIGLLPLDPSSLLSQLLTNNTSQNSSSEFSLDSFTSSSSSFSL